MRSSRAPIRWSAIVDSNKSWSEAHPIWIDNHWKKILQKLFLVGNFTGSFSLVDGRVHNRISLVRDNYCCSATSFIGRRHFIKIGDPCTTNITRSATALQHVSAKFSEDGGFLISYTWSKASSEYYSQVDELLLLVGDNNSWSEASSSAGRHQLDSRRSSASCSEMSNFGRWPYNPNILLVVNIHCWSAPIKLWLVKDHVYLVGSKDRTGTKVSQ